MQNNNPKVSVIMATHNGQKYLRQSIESILEQTFRDFEFLIVNDGSDDRTAGILRNCAEEDSRVKIIANKQNFGLTKSLNKAMNQARGKYIARMDDDDISFPTRLEKQFSFMEKNPNVVLCGTLALIINEQGNEIGRKSPPTSPQDIKNKLLFNNQFVHPSLFFRAGFQGEYNEEFERAQDYEFVLRAASKHSVANLGEYLIKWRKTRGSLSFSGTKQQKCAIRARWWAITKYGYPKVKGFLHILPRVCWLLVPRIIKQKLAA